MMKETSWHYFRTDGIRHRMKVEYGIDYDFARRHNQQPYFSMTGDIDQQRGNGRWMEYSGGRIDYDIERRMPSLAPYLKWINVGPAGPAGYFENGKYWLEMVEGNREAQAHVNPMDAFLRTIVLGAFPGDMLSVEIQVGEWHGKKKSVWSGPKEWSPKRESAVRSAWPEVRTWLGERLPKLQAAWVVDMGELGVLEE